MLALQVSRGLLVVDSCYGAFLLAFTVTWCQNTQGGHTHALRWVTICSCADQKLIWGSKAALAYFNR